MLQLRFLEANLFHRGLELLIDGVDRIFGFRHQRLKLLFISNQLLNFVLSGLERVADLHQVYTVHAIDHHAAHVAEPQRARSLHIETYHRHVAHIIQDGRVEGVAVLVCRLVGSCSCLFSWCLHLPRRLHTVLLLLQIEWGHAFVSCRFRR